MGGDLAVELPFTLTHPKPPPSPSPKIENSPNNVKKVVGKKGAGDQTVPLDLNLIQFDTK